MADPVPVTTIAQYLDAYLRVREIPDHANALNGLQVENGSGHVARIVAAVDASLATIQGAVTRRDGGAQGEGCLLLVHHGLFWDGNLTLTGRRYRRVRALLDQDIALYSAHIPLDVHAEVGNNHVLARELGCSALLPFDMLRGMPIGVAGTLSPPVPREALRQKLETLLGGSARLIPGGPEDCERVGVITGAAAGSIAAAREAGLDTFITGEGPHHSFFDAMELGINVIFGGHYATETVGVKALAAHCAERFGLPWEFHDHPTGL